MKRTANHIRKLLVAWRKHAQKSTSFCEAFQYRVLSARKDVAADTSDMCHIFLWKAVNLKISKRLLQHVLEFF